ncbi:MAG: NUDIX hydrolase [Chlamydiia bacterium]|nr:NUDIX hydrolase [Chlamydiia bacterium]
MAPRVFLTPPDRFVPELTVVGCYCEWEGAFLLLKRHPQCLSGGKWCLPGGKLNVGESRIEGARRELQEEVGVEGDLSHFLTFYIMRDTLQYDFALYRCTFPQKPQLRIHLEEHTEGRWVTHKEAKILPLIDGGEQVLDLCLENL